MKRESGYYWVKRKSDGIWLIAKWVIGVSEVWLYGGGLICSDEKWLEIDENQIKRN